jgi:FkbM family methyltransferase
VTWATMRLAQVTDHTVECSRNYLGDLIEMLPRRYLPADLTPRYQQLMGRSDLPEAFEAIIQCIYERMLKPGMCAIDGGAHRGRHTFPMGNVVGPKGHVFAFEPIPMLATKLQDELSNQPSLPISIHRVAISNYVGQSSFVVTTNDMGYSGLRERRYPEGMAMGLQTVAVKVDTLDNIIPHDRRVGFLKLDLEGGEFHALQGAERILTKDKPVVVFENGREANALSYGYTADEFFGFFSRINYSLSDLLGAEFSPKLWDHKYLPWNYLAVPDERSWDEILSVVDCEVARVFPELMRC